MQMSFLMLVKNTFSLACYSLQRLEPVIPGFIKVIRRVNSILGHLNGLSTTVIVVIPKQRYSNARKNHQTYILILSIKTKYWYANCNYRVLNSVVLHFAISINSEKSDNYEEFR